MTPTLHPYQENLVSKLMTMPRAALFLEMGLGKTAIILSLISRLKEKQPGLRFLILAPPAVASLTYPEEVKKWAPHLKCVVLTHPRVKYRLHLVEYSQHDIGISSNQSLRWLIQKRLHSTYDGIIIDESSTVFGKHNTQNFTLLKSILHCFPYRYIMTGTPVPNSYEQLWSQFYILDNGQRLGADFHTYRRAYFVPAQYSRFKFNLIYKADQTIMDKVSDITFALKMRDVALQLPPLTHKIIPTDLPSELETLYRQFKKDYIITYKATEVEEGKNPAEQLHYNRYDEKEFMLIADTASALLERLLQFCSGAVYVKDNDVRTYNRIHDLKARTLGRILRDHSGKALLIYRYIHERDLILSMYPDDVVGYNGNPSHIQQWVDGKTPRVLMAHPKSIGTGLNLQKETDTIIWMGFTWDLQQWQQTNARLHRPGQTKPVRALYIATGEIEYYLLKRLQQKDKTLLKFMSTMKSIGQTAEVNKEAVSC